MQNLNIETPYVELNMMNYNEDDVAQLNAWGIEASELISRLKVLLRDAYQSGYETGYNDAVEYCQQGSARLVTEKTNEWFIKEFGEPFSDVQPNEDAIEYRTINVMNHGLVIDLGSKTITKTFITLPSGSQIWIPRLRKWSYCAYDEKKPLAGQTIDVCSKDYEDWEDCLLRVPSESLSDIETCTCPVLDGIQVTGSSCPEHGLPSTEL